MKQLKYFDDFVLNNDLQGNTMKSYKFVLDKISENDMDEIDFINQSEDEIINFIMNKLGVRSYTSDIITKRLSVLFRYYSQLYDERYITQEQYQKIVNVSNSKDKFSQLLIQKQSECPAFPLPSSMFKLLRKIDTDDEILNNNYYHVITELIFKGLNDAGLESFYNLKRLDVHTIDGTIDVKTHDESYNLFVGKDLCNRLMELYRTDRWESWANEQEQTHKRYYSMRGRDRDSVFKFTTNTIGENSKKMQRLILKRLSFIDDRYNLKKHGIEFKPTRIFYSGLYYRATKEILKQGLNISAITERKFASEESKKCRDILQAEMNRVHLHKSVSITRTNFISVVKLFAEDVAAMEKKNI